MGYECDDERYNEDAIHTIKINSVPPINLWRSGTTYGINEVYNVWKEVFDNCNNNNSNNNEIVHDDVDLIVKSANTIIESANIGINEGTVTNTRSKRCRLNVLESESEMDNYWRAYTTNSTTRDRRMSTTQCNIDNEIITRIVVR